MAIGFKHGYSGGGNLLNFTVVSSSTQPTSPKENTIWVNGSWTMHRWDISPDQPCRVGKDNLIVFPYYESDHTEDGITFTVNSDKTITANGTATAQSDFRFANQTVADGMLFLPAGQYTLSGCPSGGSTSTYVLMVTRLNDSGTWEVFQRDYGSGVTFTLNRDTYCAVLLRVAKGATVSNLTVGPMLVKGGSSSPFTMGNATGQVWIKTNPSSSVSLNGIKKNGIFFRPSAAYEYTTYNGWKKKDVQIYQNGAWKALEDPSAPVTPEAPWDGYYFNNGNQYTGVTGGWDTTGWNSSGTTTVGSTIVASFDARVGTVNTVDLSSVKKLWFDSPTGNNGYNFGYLCALSKKGSTDFAAAVTITAGRGSLDVSSLSGQYYLCVYAGTGAYADISAIWKE